MEQRHWIDNVADLLSGRMNNTLVSLHNRLRRVEKDMTKNQETINNVAQELSGISDEFDAGIKSLKDQIAAGAAPEDLDFAALETITDKLKASADMLTPAPANTPSTGTDSGTDTQGSTGSGPVASPIDPTNLPPTPLAGSSGPTDAGVPTQVQAPGTPNPDPATTPVATDATAEAGNGTSTELPAPTPIPETDAGEIGGTVVEDGQPILPPPVQEPDVPPTADSTESSDSPNENPTGEAPTGDSSVSSAGGTAAGSPIPTSSPSAGETGSSPSAPTSGTASGDGFDD